jgi:DNA-binding NarL/FixJ family response regulator
MKWEMTMIKLLIADDHAIVRDGLKQLLGLFEDVDLAAEAADGGQVLDALRKDKFDLLLMDMSMPGISGLDLITRIKNHYPSQRILLLSMHTDPNLATRALKAGAHGYLSKDSDSATLIAAIRKVASGGHFLDPSMGVQMVVDVSGDVLARPETGLTDREYSVLQMLLNGLGVNEIARDLCISNKTVSTHKMRLMKKLGVENTAELVRYAIKHGLASE